MGKVVRIVFFILIFVRFSSIAQERPVYSHYWLNPYFINPSLAGKADKIEVHMGHRQQWLGIEDAPMVSFLNFHMPLDQKMSVGFNAYNFKRGLLATTHLLLSFGYHAMFGKSHGLRFGITGGMGNNSLDLDKADNPNDPALANIPLNSIYLDGQFGLTYYLKDFSIGITLTELFDRELIGSESLGGIASDPLKSFSLNARYKLQKKNTRIGFEPYILYEVKNKTSNYFEGGGIVHFYDAFHFGGSFRQFYGPTIHTGYTFLEKFTLGYAYELATQQRLGIGKGTHEIHLAFQFDKKRKVNLPQNKTKNKTNEIKNNTDPDPKPGPGYRDKEYIKLKEDTLNILKPSYPEVTIIRKGNHPQELSIGFYVVISTFSSEKLAQKQEKTLNKDGYDAKMGYGSETKQYYLYLSRSSDIQSAQQQKLKLSRSRLFKDVWLLKVE